MSLVAWSKACLLKSEGGLGLRDLNTWNKALLSKVLWNVHSKSDALWIRWIHAEYLRGEDIWEIVPKMRDSPLIKNVLLICDRLLVDCAWNVEEDKKLLEGWFTTKGTSAAYEFLQKKGEVHYWHKKIWKPYIPPRFFISHWLGLQERLKTADRLKFLNISQVCILCNTCDETNSHLFFACSAADAVWSCIKVWLKLHHRIYKVARARERRVQCYSKSMLVGPCSYSFTYLVCKE